MPVERLLSGFLSRDPEQKPDAAVLHECRHCGSKFDEPVARCPVCETTEIATYEFPTANATAQESDADGREDADVPDDNDDQEDDGVSSDDN